MSKFLEHKYTLPVILLAAFILRLIPAVAAISEPERLLRPDSASYLEPAAALAENGTYPTTRRPPGYPLLAAAVYFAGGNNAVIALLQVLISTATCAVVYAAARHYAGKSCGVLAAIFMALNITAIANTPLLLSDTLFALFAALQFLFFIRYSSSGKLRELLLCVTTAALAVLIRPINQLFIIVLIFLLLVKNIHPVRIRVWHSLAALGIFLLLITPWMYRNYRCGATFDIDTNTGAMRHQNGAMLMAKVNGTDFESEKQKLLAEEKEVFSTSPLYDSIREREKWRKAEFRTMVMKYPFTYFCQHFDLRILLPDAPSLLENFGITSSDRGTMGVLKKDGLFAAVKHYFGERWYLILTLLLPLLLPVAITYASVLRQLLYDCRHISTGWFELLLFLGFAEYYFFLPGAITAPRYQLPALPVLCTLAASACLTYFKNKNDTECSENPSGMEM